MQTKAPTCGAKGISQRTCARCSTTEQQTLDPTGYHTWDDGVVVTPATQTETGTMKFTCSVCHYSQTRVIPAGGGEPQATEAPQTEPTQPETTEPETTEPETTAPKGGKDKGNAPETTAPTKPETSAPTELETAAPSTAQTAPSIPNMPTIQKDEPSLW